MGKKKLCVRVEIAPKIILTFGGDSLAEFQEDIREGCLFVERCGLNPTMMMRQKAAFDSMHNLCKELRKAFRDSECLTFLSPECDTYRKLYDPAKSKFRSTAHIIKEDDEASRPKAKPCKSEEGTTHLSPDMTTGELREAIGKGGKKTVDLDDIDSMRSLLSEAKKELK